MLAGTGVTAIWNDVVPEARGDFLAWHMREHMAERVALPGFRRARRHVALDAATRPAFFTFYEADSLAVLQGHDYANRLNGPTPWTRQVMATLRGVARVLAEVVESRGAGLGGTVLTLRFDGPAQAASPLAALVRAAAERPGIAGAHLCRSDLGASGADSGERRLRAAHEAPLPAWFIILEGADAEAFQGLLPDGDLAAAGAGPAQRGCYRLEFLLGAPACGISRPF